MLASAILMYFANRLSATKYRVTPPAGDELLDDVPVLGSIISGLLKPYRPLNGCTNECQLGKTAITVYSRRNFQICDSRSVPPHYFSRQGQIMCCAPAGDVATTNGICLD
jgi:hypothetical protein